MKICTVNVMLVVYNLSIRTSFIYIYAIPGPFYTVMKLRLVHIPLYNYAVRVDANWGDQ